MKLLVIGGTQFVGRALVEVALERGHQLTLFHRGKTNPDLFPDVQHVLGDRDGEIAALGDAHWDVVIDTCGYVPRVVRQSADYLAQRVERYCFISTISVYAALSGGDASGPINEDAPLATMDDESIEAITGETYGPLKVLCEQVVTDVYHERALIVRPGLIVGPHDPTNRFTYWVSRLARGGEVLAPGTPDQPVQFIDVRDLAAWTLDRIEQAGHGVYNATGPAQPWTLGDFLTTCRAVAASDATLTWVPEALLLAHEVQPFTELPFWLPGDAAQTMLGVRIDRALAAGLTLRPVDETVRATLAWVQALAEPPGRAGLAPEREAALLAAHHGQDDTA